MELYQLKTFAAVAEERHLTKAAARLNISQPSVSSHIKALEEELGLKLFIRTPKGMVLSRDGESILPQAQLALQAAEAVRDRADQLKQSVSGAARIGLNIDAQYLRASELLTTLQRKYPKIEIHYAHRHSAEACSQLQYGQLDAAFVFDRPANSGFEAKGLGEFDIVVVAPYPWRHRLKGVDLDGLAQFPWIWADDRCPFNRIIHHLFGSSDRKPEKALVVEDDATIRKMVVAGAGLGLMIEPEALEASRQRQVWIWDEPAARLELSLLYLKDRADEPVIRAVIETVEDVWGQPT